jgi:hypothetical protein
MTGGIFLISDDNQLVELSSAAYDSEALLQELLERYPNLLAGEQIDAAAPRRWLLVTREAAVPTEADGGGRWSLDHLFLDQEGIPTLVEVKRSTDTRIRREVVGQMLDYAANGVAYWPVETIRAMYESRAHAAGLDPTAVLIDFLGPEGQPDAFWHAVKVNLRAGRIRCVFVADEIPPELRRVVEFLNNQMDPAEVLAVEIRQYVGGSFRGLVPRVLGQTEQGNRKKTAAPTGQAAVWDESRLLEELGRRFGPVWARVARRLLEWGRVNRAGLWWGNGTQSGSVFVSPVGPGSKVWPFAIWTYGKIEVQFQGLVRHPAFASEERRRELQRRLNHIPGVSITDDSLTKRPSFSLELLDGEDAFGTFVEVMAWVATTLRDTVPAAATEHAVPSRDQVR